MTVYVLTAKGIVLGVYSSIELAERARDLHAVLNRHDCRKRDYDIRARKMDDRPMMMAIELLR